MEAGVNDVVVCTSASQIRVQERPTTPPPRRQHLGDSSGTLLRLGTPSEAPQIEADAAVPVTIRGLSKGVLLRTTLRLGLSGLAAGRQVGAELGVRLVREFGLALPEKGGWLDEELSLGSQGVVAESELVFKKKFFVADEELTPADRVDVELLYPQCVDGFIHGSFSASQVHAVGLAALAGIVLQSGAEQRAGVSELAELLPTELRKGSVVKCVMDQLEALQGLTVADATFQFVHICSMLPGYGASYYVVGDAGARRAPAISSMEKTPVLLGVSRDGVARLHPKTRDVLESFPLHMLEAWFVGRQTFVMDFGANRPSGHMGVSTRSGRVLSQLITGYKRLIAERQSSSSQPVLAAAAAAGGPSSTTNA